LAWNLQFDILVVVEARVVQKYKEILFRMVSNGTVVESSVFNKAELKVIIDLKTIEHFLSVIFDYFSIILIVVLHAFPDSVGIVICHSLSAGSCDCVMMLVDSKSILHFIGSLHQFLFEVIRLVNLEKLSSVEAVRSMEVVRASSNVFLVVCSTREVSSPVGVISFSIWEHIVVLGWPGFIERINLL
jgi:hypothetical protein